jgi:hypothetical protein
MAKSIRVDLDYAAINRVLNMPEGMVGREVLKRAFKVRDAAKAQILARNSKYSAESKNPGRLFRSIRVYGHTRKGVTGQELYIGSAVTYAIFVHNGTKPHVIMPKDPKGVLIFPSRGASTTMRAGRSSSKYGGSVIIAKRVVHPGYKGNHFLTDNIKLFYK